MLGAHDPKTPLHETKPIKVAYFGKKATWVVNKRIVGNQIFEGKRHSRQKHQLGRSSIEFSFRQTRNKKISGCI